MAKALAIPLHELIVNKSRALKYPVLIWKTLYILLKDKLKIVFVQNPSIVLSFVVVVYAKIYNIKVIVDAHNAGIYPLEGRNAFLNRVAKFIAKNATAVIVSNAHLAKVVNDWGGSSFVMPDPIPDGDHPYKLITPDRPYIYFICSWADDEPYHEVIKASQHIPNNLDIYITGNYKKRLSDDDVKSIPTNVKLLGFLSEQDYVSYFKNSLAALDLTTRDHCLVCGAYEALALEKPCIISDSVINKEIFQKGFLYTKNDSESIANAINKILQNIHHLESGIKEQKEIHKTNILQNINSLRNRIFK